MSLSQVPADGEERVTTHTTILEAVLPQAEPDLLANRCEIVRCHSGAERVEIGAYEEEA